MPKEPWRSLADVPEDELIEAVKRMSLELGIPGSSGIYSLYGAILREKQKVLDLKYAAEKDFGKQHDPQNE